MKVNRNGAAAVEAALLTPLLMIVGLGIIDVGQFIVVNQQVVNATRLGSRMAARDTTTTTSEVETVVEEFFFDSMPGVDSSVLSQAIQVTVLNSDGITVTGADLNDIQTGERIEVQVTLDFSTIRWLKNINYWDLELDPFSGYSRRE